MGMISLVQERFACFSPSDSPTSAQNVVYTAGSSRANALAKGDRRSTKTATPAANSTGGSVRSSCTRNLARSGSFGSSGSDCAIQRFFPSSETLGVAISFMDARAQMQPMAIAAGKSVSHANHEETTSRTVSQRISRYTAPIGSISVPSPQLSM